MLNFYRLVSILNLGHFILNIELIYLKLLRIAIDIIFRIYLNSFHLVFLDCLSLLSLRVVSSS
jgi:hypothetical protein